MIVYKEMLQIWQKGEMIGVVYYIGMAEGTQDLLTDAHIMFVILARIFLNEPDSLIVKLFP